MAFIPLLNLKMPGFLVTFFEAINSLNLGFEFLNLEGLLDGKFGIFKDLGTKFSNKFESVGYTTSNIFVNMEDVFVFLIVFLVSILICFFFYIACKRFDKVSKFFKKILKGF